MVDAGLQSRFEMRRKSTGWKRVRLNATDILFSKVVRARDKGECQQLGCGRRASAGWQLECAHYISRRFKQTRWVLSNATTLCHIHHRWYSEHATEWELLARRRLGREYDRLLLLAKGPAQKKPDEVMVRAALREELRRLESRVTV